MEQNKTSNTYLYVVFIVFALAFFVSFTFTYAQDKRADLRTTLQEKKDALREEIQNKSSDVRENLSERKAEFTDKRTEAREKLDEKKAERKEKLNEKAKGRINAYIERITKRLVAALDRIEKITERIESRITKLEEKFEDRNLDLSESKRLLEVAQQEVASARTSISAVKNTAVEAINADNPKESFSAVRELIKDATASVKSAHRALVEAIKSIKASVEPTNTEDSSVNNE